MYWKAIPVIEAQQSLAQITSISFPDLKPQAREKLIKQLNKAAYPFKNKGSAISNEELAKKLGIIK